MLWWSPSGGVEELRKTEQASGPKRLGPPIVEPQPKLLPLPEPQAPMGRRPYTIVDNFSLA